MSIFRRQNCLDLRVSVEFAEFYFTTIKTLLPGIFDEDGDFLSETPSSLSPKRRLPEEEGLGKPDGRNISVTDNVFRILGFDTDHFGELSPGSPEFIYKLASSSSPFQVIYIFD
jgi:hypothetical protein